MYGYRIIGSKECFSKMSTLLCICARIPYFYDHLFIVVQAASNASAVAASESRIKELEQELERVRTQGAEDVRASREEAAGVREQLQRLEQTNRNLVAQTKQRMASLQDELKRLSAEVFTSSQH